ncbi:MAG: hypothetical protein R3D69_16205 [Xanthobacteraceae bacterium]
MALLTPAGEVMLKHAKLIAVEPPRDRGNQRGSEKALQPDHRQLLSHPSPKPFSRASPPLS